MNLADYKLKINDAIAVLAPSSGKAAEFPHVYKEGIKNLQEIFGLKVVEFPTTKMSSKDLHDNPQIRANDINKAFADPKIKGIITTIGGDDSVRILPFLDKNIIRKNPKLFMGYSDGTVLLVFLNQLGLITFHGPSVMAGFAQTQYLPDAFKDHIKKILFQNFRLHLYEPYEEYCDGYADWSDPKNAGKTNDLMSSSGWNWINKGLPTSGELFGGNIEALEFLKSTKYWPKHSFWNNKVFFLETSEEKPSLNQVKYMLRNYGTQGIFHKISALLFGRPASYTDKEKSLLEKIILNIVVQEFGAKMIPIITNFDIGHTDPQLVLPLGVETKINPSSGTIEIADVTV